jgi:hypothetical protein
MERNIRWGEQVVLNGERLQLERDIADTLVSSELVLLGHTLEISKDGATDLVVIQSLLDCFKVGRGNVLA